jgi:hypothetical protein
VNETRNAPLALTWPLPFLTETLPPEMEPGNTPALHPVATKFHEPSNRIALPARAGRGRTSVLDLLPLADISGSGNCVPDNDLSFLPIVPPVLPCAKLSERSKHGISMVARTAARQTNPEYRIARTSYG